ncbi:cytochrome P450 [Kitasatospora sp. NBC_01300]|uniref:cytochrome P450 n=1 Tax=Kitasatospora sp. NBC_01300 TaxID=2903574 RepID=UPI002F9186BB|nr:cytochrome P450 [Kitasatospora sp. NBC_01300]
MASITVSSVGYEEFDQQLGSDPLGLMTRLRDEGTVSAVPLDDGTRLIVAAEPAVAAAALAHGTRNHRGLLRELVGSGLFVVASGEQWRHRRALLRPMFSARAVAELHTLVLESAEDFVRRRLLPAAGREFDLGHTLQQLSIEIILRLVDPELTGAELASLASTVDTAVHYLDRRLFAPETVTDADGEAFARDRAVLEEFIAHRAAQVPAAAEGVLPSLVAALHQRGDTPGERAEDVLREELMSIFVAGVETMGTLLTWTFHNLAGSPPALARALDEVRSTDLGALRAAPSIPQGTLPYTLAVVEESLRLHPPAWALFRRIDTPVEAAGVRLEPGDLVLASTYAIHRAPALWEAPEEFRPDRFLGRRPPVQQYFPFGAGPHQCLGRQFSLLEAQLATATILAHGRFTLLGDRASTGLRPAIALTPDPSPRAVFTPHPGSDSDSDTGTAAIGLGTARKHPTGAR